jgi:uncharacterized protein (TIGR02300 family)
MSTKAERGTKRTCQNPECGSRFYDLNRDPIVCPICETVFQLNATPAEALAATAAQEGPGARAAARRPGYQTGATEKPEHVPIAEDEDALPAIEDDEEAPATEEDETFLEAEEEDGSDMSNIIGGPVAENDEPQ